MQTGKSRVIPVIVMGTDFWKHLGPFMRDSMLAHSTISRGDLSLYTATDDPAEAVSLVRGVARAGHRATAVKRLIRAHRVRNELPV
jgi:predicted Rossmann-fold nucleotide-binding protein